MSDAIPTQMKGVQLIGHGDVDQLKFRDDIPVPVPGPDEVLIKVSAAGVNNTDINARLGWYSKSQGEDALGDSGDAGWSGSAYSFPLIQGADVCGVVVAVGANVNPALLHQRVLVEPCLSELNGVPLAQVRYLGSECDGGFAEYTVAAACQAHPVNSPMSDVELASFPCSYSTAENLLTRAGVSDQDLVLVTGASGGVGSAAIQLAKARGARVMAITSPEKSSRITALGAERTFARDDCLTQALGKNSVDVVIDLVAGQQWPELLEVLKPFGRYAVAGAIGGPLVELDVRTLYLKDLSLFGCTVLNREVFPNLIRRIEAGEVSALVEKTYPLHQLAEAQKQFLTKQHVGKIVIDVQG